MGKSIVEILAGDFSGVWIFDPKNKTIDLISNDRKVKIKVKIKEAIESIETMSSEEGGAGGAIAGGAIGALALGPLGLVAGAVFGGQKKVVFEAKLFDGRKFMGRCSDHVYTMLKACMY
jgi:hypothetical protein